MNGCLNKGSCIFDQEKETFACSCKQPWGGERCELGKPILCNFIHSEIVICFSLSFRNLYWYGNISLRFKRLYVYITINLTSSNSSSSSSTSSSSR